MEISIVKEEKNLIEVNLVGESHTLCNALRGELWNIDGTSFVSYNLKHPLVGSPVFALQVKKGNPKKVLASAADSLKGKTKELRSLLKKI